MRRAQGKRLRRDYTSRWRGFIDILFSDVDAQETLNFS
ncbi:UNVERIFIED_ORG: hypothetical protein FHW05_000240 [Pantoea agglomerans]